MKFILILISFFGLRAEMPKDARIYVAGHGGLVGSALISELQKQGYHNIIMRTSKELDLRCQAAVETFFEQEKPEYVFLAAAKVGGIMANKTHPAEFCYNNLMIECNVIHAAHKSNVKKLLFLGSSCIYPRDCAQPIKEDYLLSGHLEETNEAYALAKIAGLKLCQYYNKQYGAKFISCMPTNLYGPNDNFDLSSSHVLPALIKKFTEAKKNNAPEVVVWGTGSAYREFLYVDDCARACIFLMNSYDGNEPINVGVGEDIQLKELVFMVKNCIGYEGDIIFDTTKPDGMPRKLLNVQKLHQLGWKHSVSLLEGIQQTIDWFLHTKY